MFVPSLDLWAVNLYILGIQAVEGMGLNLKLY